MLLDGVRCFFLWNIHDLDDLLDHRDLAGQARHEDGIGALVDPNRGRRIATCCPACTRLRCAWLTRLRRLTRYAATHHHLHEWRRSATAAKHAAETIPPTASHVAATPGRIGCLLSLTISSCAGTGRALADPENVACDTLDVECVDVFDAELFEVGFRFAVFDFFDHADQLPNVSWQGQ